MRDREQILGIDLIRFLSALLVLAWHNAYRFFDPAAPHIRAFVEGVPIGDQPIQYLTRWGWIGVQVFFVISGLVIAYSAQGTTPRRFFTARVGRLMPGVLICTAIIAGIDLFFWDFGPERILIQTAKELLFWPFGDWLAPQFWTLPVEAFFYALVWLMILSGTVAHLDRLAFGLVCVSALYWALVYLGLVEVRGSIESALLLQHGFYFSIGICLSSVGRCGVSGARLGIIAAGLVLACFEIAIAMKKYSVYSAAQPWLWIVPYLIWLALVGLIVASLIWKRPIAAFMNASRLAGLVRNLGLATFPLYLIHIHVGGLATTLAIGAGVPPLSAIAIGALLCVPVSILIAVTLEPPIRKLIVRMAGTRFPVTGPVKNSPAAEEKKRI